MADDPRTEDLRRRVGNDPASIAFAQLAEEYRRAGQLAEAISVCRAGLAHHPDYVSALITLGRALIGMNELDAADAALRLVLRSAPDSLPALRGLADIHYRRGELPPALTFYRQALALARNDPGLERTVDRLTHLLENVPPEPASHAALLGLERFLEAIQTYRQRISRDSIQ